MQGVTYTSFIMKKKTYVMIIALFVLLLGACNDENGEAEESDRVIPVEAIEAKIDDFIVDKTLYGRTEPKDLTPVMLQMPGEISELPVKVGDTVEEDDLIAKIETQAGIQEINAPAAGEIVELSGKEGEMVSESDPFAMILDLNELNITLSVTKDGRSLMEDADDSDITVEIDDETYDIDVTSLGKMPDDTGLFPVEAVFENKDHHVLPGMIAKVILPEKKLKQTFVLPTEAIVEDSEGTYIYKVVDEKATKIDVTVLETQTDVTAIESDSDIEEGDQIVINGQITLSEGARVTIVEEGNES